MSMATYAQGMVLHVNTFAGAGRYSRAEPVVLAHGAQTFPLMPMCALGRLVTRVCAMTSAVVARLIYQMLLARMSPGQ